MIAYLKGTLHQKQNEQLIIDVSGVGYMVGISTQTLETLPERGEQIQLMIYHHIIDSDQRLFGFTSQKEKNLFERLITVKGIGPKLGLTILSGMPAADLIEAIVTQNTTALSGISGIGKKTAQRMVLELKDKLFDESEPSIVSEDGQKLDRKEEAVSALLALGFKKQNARKIVGSIIAENPKSDVSDIVKRALSEIKR
ncbi:Holliday junction branch migration protein RuvA [Rhodohalobacter sp. SW132]|uniref:Holliday junction branch migration protein RuvA n=1 Tax=Rhodohalobacter sp. SW132 TaxID=2293433 RepID=UPI000E22AF2D|nr:Holliday junction branch migration protein RuvA [Rhodohalobacter sp. SW132]REL39161.1 Holliday junction branch migration protein RuvA [Rhodohalobacter sp. SW132]